MAATIGAISEKMATRLDGVVGDVKILDGSASRLLKEMEAVRAENNSLHARVQALEHRARSQSREAEQGKKAFEEEMREMIHRLTQAPPSAVPATIPHSTFTPLALFSEGPGFVAPE